MQLLEYKREIESLKREKNAVILGHYYQRDEIQEVSDYIGDSLELARVAQSTDKDIIVFCGVHFMAETAKILNPGRKVLIPDITSGCYLADGCDAAELEAYKNAHPGYKVVSYINCSAEVKALSDLICTSGNAEKLISSMPKDEKIIFAPDKNLGGYINRKTGRQMLLWDGACRVHDDVEVEELKKMKEENAAAKVIAHPECGEKVLEVADFVGSTKAMLKYIEQSGGSEFIVVTEQGILYQMRKMFPGKKFMTIAGRCGCIECKYMKQNTIERLYECLKNETPEIVMDSVLIEKAKSPIERMLEMSRELGLVK